MADLSEKIPSTGNLSPTQPSTWEFFSVDGVFVKQFCLLYQNMLVPQHAHAHDHVTMLASGKVRIWADEKLLGDFTAPSGILIKAKTKHTILSLVPNTILYCIHNLHGQDEVDIHEEHQLKRG